MNTITNYVTQNVNFCIGANNLLVHHTYPYIRLAEVSETEYYDHGSNDMLNQVAVDFRRNILESFDNSKALPWPPVAEHIGSADDVVPVHLKKFLTYLISGPL